jgi:antitoxin (DNA-binding transcriptional repressor) of toxin-antitoxin stability system
MTLDDLRAAHERTVAERSARVRFRTETHLEEQLEQARHADDGALPLPLRLFRRGLGAAMQRMPKATSADGVIDFERWRCALDYGSYAVVIDGEQEWSGRSGRALDTLEPRAATARSPLWLLRALEGVREIADDGMVLVDLVAVQERGAAVPLPDVATVEEARALPFVVEPDDAGRLARIAFTGGRTTIALELLELGVELPADWSRLPAWATP